ncbi:MAG: hypothetical protein MHPSP_000646, partial [Paramarteilia canceri]
TQYKRINYIINFGKCEESYNQSNVGNNKSKIAILLKYSPLSEDSTLMETISSDCDALFIDNLSAESIQDTLHEKISAYNEIKIQEPILNLVKFEPSLSSKITLI